MYVLIAARDAATHVFEFRLACERDPVVPLATCTFEIECPKRPGGLLALKQHTWRRLRLSLRIHRSWSACLQDVVLAVIWMRKFSAALADFRFRSWRHKANALSRCSARINHDFGNLQASTSACCRTCMVLFDKKFKRGALIRLKYGI